MAHEPLTKARHEDVLTAEYIAAYAKAEGAWIRRHCLPLPRCSDATASMVWLVSI